jgi:dTDP-4-amino-4,6-dideoxygalactose transaminase
MEEQGDSIILFHPYVPEESIAEVLDTLRTRWIGQGPKVDRFEMEFQNLFCPGASVAAVGSGTDALHLAYILAGIKDGDEVITPVFTCTATNIPLLYQRANVVFADIQKDSLNVDPVHVRSLITPRTKAIVCVDYGGLPCDMDELNGLGSEYGIPVIEDAAQSLGGTYHGKPVGSLCDYTTFSFQAIKQLTTGDGGLLAFRDASKLAAAQRIRWFGIDRSAKQMGTWENDISEIGYKYQMTDIGAAMALGALKVFSRTCAHRKSLFKIYEKELQGIQGIRSLGTGHTDREHAAWIYTVAAERRVDLQRKLRENRIESNQSHYRNDRYSIFGKRRDNVPNMDYLEDRYLVLPLHTKLSEDDIHRVCRVIRSGW